MSRHRSGLRRASCLAGLLASTCVTGVAAADPELIWHRQRPGAPQPVVSQAPRNAYAYGARVPAVLTRRPFHQEIVSAARKAGIDPALVHAVIGVESAYNARAVSPKGAVGLMQVIPDTARRYGVEDLLNPRHNLSAGTQYLSYLMRIFDGDLRLVLAAYNAGENAVLRHGRRIPPYAETRGYVPRVMGIYDALLLQGRQETLKAQSSGAE